MVPWRAASDKRTLANQGIDSEQQAIFFIVDAICRNCKLAQSYVASWLLIFKLNMGRFTVYNDQWIDAQIKTLVDVIVKKIAAALPNRDISIALSGGFGRGEGSIRASENRVKPFKDHDIWTLSNPRLSVSQCSRIQNRVYKELGFQTPGGRRISIFIVCD